MLGKGFKILLIFSELHLLCIAVFMNEITNAGRTDDHNIVRT